MARRSRHACSATCLRSLDGAAGLRRCRTGLPEALRCVVSTNDCSASMNDAACRSSNDRRFVTWCEMKTVSRRPPVQRHVHESLRPGDRSRRDCVMRRAGVRTALAPNRCCGRPQISKGLLATAREMAERNTDALHAHAAAGRPIVFCEPSCLSAVKEDAPALLRGENRRRAEQVAAVSVLSRSSRRR